MSHVRCSSPARADGGRTYKCLRPPNGRPTPNSDLTIDRSGAAGRASKVPEASRTASTWRSGRDRAASSNRVVSGIDEGIGRIEQQGPGLVSV
ncbi:hypothetical protein EJB05_35893, partial [Eragrostis curvula]